MRRIASAFTLSMILALGAACGSDGGGDGDGDGDGDGEGDGDGDPGGTEFSLTWGPVDVAAGEENTQCVVVELGNTTPIKVTRFHNQLGATSHHFIVYEVPNDTPLRETPYDCQPFSDILDGAPLIVTQKAEDILQLPDRVAYSLEPNQRIRLEMHYINASDAVASLTATATFTTAAASDIDHEADFIFVGDVDINIPPMTSATVGKTFVGMPPGMSGVNYFAITGHTHQFGTNVQVATSPTEGGAETMVYDPANFSWSEPETIMHAPAFTIPDGGGFNFSCEYNNTSGQTVGFGESANDEMCFFWAYYYPSTGQPRVCAQSDQFGYACCPDTQLACTLIDML